MLKNNENEKTMSDNEQTHQKNAEGDVVGEKTATSTQPANKEQAKSEQKVSADMKEKKERKEKTEQIKTSAEQDEKPAGTNTEMTESKATAPEDPKATSEKATASTTPPKQAEQKRKSTFSWGGLLTAISLLLLTAAIGYIAYQGKLLLDAKTQEIATLERSLNATKNTQIKSLESFDQREKKARETLAKQVKQTQTALGDVNQRVSAQSKRLRALSDTSRDDWLLAEAEYLLKLANQRVRIERSPDGAEALLEDADAILRDLDDPNLHPLRRAIAKDLTALRLLQKIDVEGIYLSLVSLTGEIVNIPTHVTRTTEKADTLQPLVDTSEKRTALETVKASWKRFTHSFSEFFRVNTTGPKPKALLPIKDEVYLQQNLRLMLERAQLGLLREQQDIYQQSLTQADIWLEEYYNESAVLLNFRNELQRLASKTVVQKLPNISASLELIHEYIDVLHRLEGIRPKLKTKINPKQKPQPKPESPATGAIQPATANADKAEQKL